MIPSTNCKCRAALITIGINFAMKSVAPMFATTTRRTSESSFNGSKLTVISPSSNASLTASRINGKSCVQSTVLNGAKD